MEKPKFQDKMTVRTQRDLWVPLLLLFAVFGTVCTVCVQLLLLLVLLFLLLLLFLLILLVLFSACAQAGVLSKCGWALENVVARICREAGGRVTTNVVVRDLDLGQPDVVDGRRLEVIVDGLPLHRGALAIDSTLVCVLSTETAHRWVVLQSVRRRKERTNPELLVRSWLSSLLKSEAGGLKRRGCSCLCWPEPKLAARIHCFASGFSKLGGCTVVCTIACAVA